MRAKVACFWRICLAGSWQAAARHRRYRVNPHIPPEAVRLLLPMLLFAGMPGLVGCTPTVHDLVIVNVDIVDVDAGEIERGTLVVDDGVISARLPPGADVPAATTRIDGTGRFAIPGLWDMHVHTADESFLESYVRHGIVGVRDMGGGVSKPTDGCESLAPDRLRELRREVEEGSRWGPEIHMAGLVASGTGWPTSLPVTTPEQARDAIRRLTSLQVDFVKVYEEVPLDTYGTLLAEAHEAGLDVAGHVPEEIPLSVAASMGQRSIEHVREPLMLCFTTDAAELEALLVADDYGEEGRAWAAPRIEDCPRAFAAFRRQGTFFVPTLRVARSPLAALEPATLRDTPLRLALPPSIRQGHIEHADRWKAQPELEIASVRLWFATQKRLVARLVDEGLPVMAGSDSSCEGVLPGQGLHEELALLVEAGLSEAAALATATTVPARYWGANNSQGRLVQGYEADFVLLGANPLQNIRHTGRIEAVIIDGRLVEAPEAASGHH